jgi:hypothetical protein
MNDNLRRGLRTGLQALLGFVAGGALSKIWESYVSNHAPVDPTVYLAVSLFLTAFAAWAMNAVEDATGVAILAPKDREIGDTVLREGLGQKAAVAGGGPFRGRDM